ncbi:MbtH family protein [Legionella hackeliae]|uniref:Putative MbtH-like protein n=1 Tax=Legionella hackeliae TaxID=449 RepID=A0A0A8UX10_LEGHA|nr:MbtH family NRPS accessory protein [Legionella hackeliae]KTD06594.1 MbtH-like protein [Legionella hackeliae]CEK11612.1 putative MbtH-like protein [Legionella hackeliae]STX48382.1 Uncharacterized protein conserved in bacteria [Legionella hackeliae]
MSQLKDSNKEDYIVLVNDEGQYSIWPKHKKIPLGWRSSDKEGVREDCLKYIAEAWIDMTPNSLRKRINRLS